MLRNCPIYFNWFLILFSFNGPTEKQNQLCLTDRADPFFVSNSWREPLESNLQAYCDIDTREAALSKRSQMKDKGKI